jgi:hypothetical protein
MVEVFKTHNSKGTFAFSNGSLFVPGATPTQICCLEATFSLPLGSFSAHVGFLQTMCSFLHTMCSFGSCLNHFQFCQWLFGNKVPRMDNRDGFKIANLEMASKEPRFAKNVLRMNTRWLEIQKDRRDRFKTQKECLGQIRDARNPFSAK